MSIQSGLTRKVVIIASLATKFQLLSTVIRLARLLQIDFDPAVAGCETHL